MKFLRKTIRTALRHGTENPRSVQLLTENMPMLFHRTIGGRWDRSAGRISGTWMRNRLRKWIITRPAVSLKNFNPAK